jgi:hypothetical protein
MAAHAPVLVALVVDVALAGSHARARREERCALANRGAASAAGALRRASAARKVSGRGVCVRRAPPEAWKRVTAAADVADSAGGADAESTRPPRSFRGVYLRSTRVLQAAASPPAAPQPLLRRGCAACRREPACTALLCTAAPPDTRPAAARCCLAARWALPHLPLQLRLQPKHHRGLASAGMRLLQLARARADCSPARPRACASQTASWAQALRRRTAAA